MNIKLLLLLPFLLLAGCSFISDNQTSVRIATQYTTLKYVEDGAGIDTERAQRVYDTALEIEDYLSAGELITVDGLQLYILNSVDWSALSPADTIAARTFIDYLAYELQSRLDDSGESNALFSAQFVVGVVVDTLRPYVE